MTTLLLGLALIYTYNLLKNIYYYIRTLIIITQYTLYLENKNDNIKTKYAFEASELISIAGTAKHLNYHGIRIDPYRDFFDLHYCQQITLSLCETRDYFSYQIRTWINPILLIKKNVDVFGCSLLNRQYNFFKRIVSFFSSGIVLFLLGLYSSELKYLLNNLFTFIKNLINV